MRNKTWPPHPQLDAAIWKDRSVTHAGSINWNIGLWIYSAQSQWFFFKYLDHAKKNKQTTTTTTKTVVKCADLKVFYFIRFVWCSCSRLVIRRQRGDSVLNSSNPVSTFWFFLSVTTRAFSELPHHWLDPRALPLFSLDCAAKPSCQPMWRGQQNVRHLNSRGKKELKKHAGSRQAHRGGNDSCQTRS